MCQRSLWVLPLLGLGGLLAAGPARAQQPDRVAWLGLERGPLAPKEAELLERLILDELDGYESIRTVDTGGNALDERLLATEAGIVTALIDEGIDLYLNFKHAEARQKLEQAIAIFQSKLTGLADHELLHDALLAKAEAENQGGRTDQALATLSQLAALRPRKSPTTKTHPRKLVDLWQRAKSNLGPVGTVRIEAEDGSCVVQLDEKALGPPPVEVPSISPGQHYVTARWPFALTITSIQVSPGRETKVLIQREGPSEEARRSAKDLITRGGGQEEAEALIRRVAALALAEEILVAAVLSNQDGGRSLVVAKHDRDGRPNVIAELPLQSDDVGDETKEGVRRLAAVLFLDHRPGELQILPDGSIRPRPGLLEWLYARHPLSSDDEDSPGEGPTRIAAASPFAPPSAKEEPSAPITEAWWFWAGLGLVVLAAGGAVAAVALRPEADTTEFEVLIP